MGCFHILAFVNNSAINMGVKIPVRVPAFTTLRHISRSGFAGSCGNSMFNFFFLSEYPTVFPFTRFFRVFKVNL